MRSAAAGARPATAPPRDRRGDPSTLLPPGCPVTPLGVDGDVRYYLNVNRQLRALPDEKHGRLSLMGMFDGQEAWLREHFPRIDKEGSVTGWRPEAVAAQLMQATGAAGIWNADDRERGRGAWAGDDGELVIHTGDKVLVFPAVEDLYHAPAQHESGLIGRYVYPAGETAGVPAAPRSPGLGTAAEELLALLSSWNWKRRPTEDSDVELDAVLLLGWLGAAMIGGALPWRPTIWFTGGTGTGKSTLHKLLHLLFGDARVQTSDATGPSLWQTLKHQTLPVFFEELEARADNRKAEAVIELARLAPSGGKLMRGTDRHKAVEFTIRSCFAFSSILMPPLKPADRSRITVLELGRLPDEAPEPELDPKRLRALGALLRRRMIDGWTRFGRTFAYYRSALQQLGHSARGADQFGTLLTAADILLFDGEVDPQMAQQWVSRAGAADLTETSESVDDPQACLGHLLQAAVDPFRGGRRMLSEYVQTVLGRIDGHVDDARRALAMYGLTVWTNPKDRRRWLAVANQHGGLASLFIGTHWSTSAASIGVWVQTLRRLPGAQVGPSIYMGGVQARCTLVPIDLVPVPDQQSELPFDAAT